jgi:hypothetical protein
MTLHDLSFPFEAATPSGMLPARPTTRFLETATAISPSFLPPLGELISNIPVMSLLFRVHLGTACSVVALAASTTRLTETEGLSRRCCLRSESQGRGWLAREESGWVVWRCCEVDERW